MLGTCRRAAWSLIVGLLCLSLWAGLPAGEAHRSGKGHRMTGRQALRRHAKRPAPRHRHRRWTRGGRLRAQHARPVQRTPRQQWPAPIAVAPDARAEAREHVRVPTPLRHRTAPALDFSPVPAPPNSSAELRSVRFDAAYYYGRGQSAGALAEGLTQSWAEQGLNAVSYYAYNRVYGARYATSYPGVILEDYGRQDLLGRMLDAAHARGQRVFAWLYGPQSKQLWEAHPEWRQRRADGSDFRPDADGYPLCVSHPEVRAWWVGLVDDLLARYPELDGVDIAEAQVAPWGDTTCHCEHCRAAAGAGLAAWRQARADGLTTFLRELIAVIHRHGKEAHLTTVFTARPDGSLMSPQEVREATGFDLEALLTGPDRPEVIQAELIWQQWAAAYATPAFTPEWTERAVREAQTLVAGRARLIAHVELTDFGGGGPTRASLDRTIAAALAGGAQGVDLYDAHLLDHLPRQSQGQ